MLLAVPKTKTKLYGDRLFAARAPRLCNALPEDIKNSRSLNILRLKLEDSCSASAIEYIDHIIVEYREYYCHCYYYVQSINNISITLQYSFSCFSSEILCNCIVSYTACNLNLGF